MYVNDLDAARDFFVSFLGGRSNEGYHNRNTDSRSYFISFDDGARMEIMNKPEILYKNKHMYAKTVIRSFNLTELEYCHCRYIFDDL